MVARCATTPCAMYSDYIVFVDESGDHSLTSIDNDYPLFVLCFCIVRKSDYATHVVPQLKQIKFEFFGHDCVVLHESDIRRRRGPFSRLSKESREALLSRLTAVIARAPLTVVGVAIDKRALAYRLARHVNPYHMALEHGLESVRSFLRLAAQDRGMTHVVCEARGAREDGELELAFRRVCDGDNQDQVVYPFQLVICDKRSNSEGLQLADLMARPIGLHVLRPYQPNRAFEVLARKFFGSEQGTVRGSGLKVLPRPIGVGDMERIEEAGPRKAEAREAGPRQAGPKKAEGLQGSPRSPAPAA